MLWPQPWPSPGKRVVLGEDADPRAVRPEAAGKPAADGGGQAPGRVLHGVPVPGDRLGKPRRRLVLLERRLRVGVDAVGQLEDLVPAPPPWRPPRWP